MRVFIVVAIVAFLGVMIAPGGVQAHHSSYKPEYNQFAKLHCEAKTYEFPCQQAAAGDTWESLFPDAAHRDLVMRINRQNKPLWLGQWLLVPHAAVSYESLAPFAKYGFDEYEQVFVFAPHKEVLAWALYESGQRVRWGPAVGGKDYCPDVQKGCRTNVGTFKFLEAANSSRRSSAFPVGCRTNPEKPCARMPYFSRFTHKGQGLHARDMHGLNASHGCVGAFDEDAIFINGYIRTAVDRASFGYLTRREIERSPAFIVLPYDLKPQKDTVIALE